MPRTPSLTDVDELLVGHYTLRGRPTGCTVITATRSFVAGVDVRGGAPGTREIELLRPESSVNQIDAIFLSGGSAFGLETAGGVSRFIEEQERGFETGAAKVPIVCGAILYDLSLGDAKIRPDANAGYEAARKANSGQVLEGNVGAGAGATVGKMLGNDRAMKGGLGSWALCCPDGLQVGALAVVNAVGDIVDPATGRTIAGAKNAEGEGFVEIVEELQTGGLTAFPFPNNTVLAVVATNARLTKTQCTVVARMAQDALARCISPSHTPWDGDAVFGLATGRWETEKEADPGRIGALAADVLARAIIRGVLAADTWETYSAARDYC
jgi:L-aminopeptidase/D-esterase-like protein